MSRLLRQLEERLRAARPAAAQPPTPAPAQEQQAGQLLRLGHELRTPLSALAAAVAVLEAVPCGSPDALQARAVISRQTRRLAEIVDEMLRGATKNDPAVIKLGSNPHG